MLREMQALFGEGMWDYVMVAVSFWSYSEAAIAQRNMTCQATPEYCHDEAWFKNATLTEIQKKFHLEGFDIPYAFIDSWSQV